jgi:heme/copper-type cytochrome/quinol oxidase subunit 3
MRPYNHKDRIKRRDIMETSLEHAEHIFELEPQVKVARARAGVLMLIVSDALSVLAIFAAGGYLSALNTENQFKVAGDFAPPLVPNLLVMIALLLSGLCYFAWARRASRSGDSGQALFFLVGLVLMLAACVAETWIGAALRYGIPIHAYESLLLLITWFTAIHLLLTAIIGVLLGGRILRGRLAGHEFLVEAAGYWWYYTVVASIILWLFGAFLI